MPTRVKETIRASAAKMRFRSQWRRKFARISNLLVGEYGRPDLGNLVDPVDEIFYILLSAKTTEALYQAAHRRLAAKFPNLRAIAQAQIEELVECVKCAGLGNKRGEQIKKIAEILVRDFGAEPSAKLAQLGQSEAFEYLTKLPGVGPKSAFCVMMMSLSMPVFPVDVNVYRIAHRLGAIPSGLKHYQAQELLPQLVPPRRSRDLHVGLVVHGRQVCLPRKPKCCQCVLRKSCSFGQTQDCG